MSVVYAIPNVSVETTFKIKLLTFSGAFLPLYPVFCIVLLSIVNYAASLAFQSIASKLNASGDRQPCLSNTELGVLKSYYVSVCQTIDVINDCFGWLLLLIIPHLFVATITLTFYWFGNKPKPISGLMFFFFHHVNLFIVCIAADSVRIEVLAYLTVYQCDGN